jgi:hypothetical protein
MTSADIRQAIAAFGTKLGQLSGQGATGVEMATRPEVHAIVSLVLNQAAGDVEAQLVHDQNVRGTLNRPDWAVYEPSPGGTYFYGDHKPISAGALRLTAAERRQIMRYREMGRPVFVFDGHTFLFFDDASPEGHRVELYDRRVLNDSSRTLDLNSDALARLTGWFSEVGFHLVPLGELIDQAARRGRMIRDELNEMLESTAGSGLNIGENALIDSCHQLQADLVESGRVTLVDSPRCADYIAQVLAFGMVYTLAKIGDEGSSPSERAAILECEFLGLADESISLPPFAEIVTQMADQFALDENFLGYWYRDAVRYFANVKLTDYESAIDYHELFERFLRSYDPRTRFEYGAFYTPAVLAKWLATQVNQLSIDHFGLPVTEVADQIVDPCCGTGGLLEAVMSGSSAGSQTEYVGIEIMPVPYALAQFRLRQGYERDAVHLFLTDALDDALDSIASPAASTSPDLRGARERTRMPIRVVVANPPSIPVKATAAGREHSNAQIAQFRPTDPTARSNIQKALNNDAYRFLAWSVEKVLSAGSGIVALVMPGGMASSPSFVGLRTWMTQHFDHIRVLQLDADLRTGAPSDSLFGSQQGHLVVFAVRTTAAGTEVSARLSFADVVDASKVAKISLLEADQINFRELDYGSDPECRWMPLGEVDRLWASFTPLFGEGGIFLHKSSGVKLAPTALLFHTDPVVLERRRQQIVQKAGGQFRYTPEEIIARWYAGQQKPVPIPKLTPQVRDALADAHDVLPFSFRPFLRGVVQLEAAVLRALSGPGSGTRSRPELLGAFARGAVGLVVAPNPSHLGTELHRFVSVSSVIPDNDFVARDNAMVYPDIWEDGTVNVADDVLARLAMSARELIYYVNAILSSSHFRERFSQELFRGSGAGTFPRVPLDQAARVLISLGERLALLEDVSVAVALTGSNDKLLRELGAQIADWPAEFDFGKWSTSDGAIELRAGGTTVARLENVPSRALELTISGHVVIEKWLREHSVPYLRRKFNRADATRLVEAIGRICEQEVVLDAIDVEVDALLAGWG